MADQYVQYPNITVSTSTPTTVKIEDTAGNPITTTAGALNVNASNPSVGVDGAAAPASSTQIGGQFGGNLQPVKLTAAGALVTDSSAVTQPVSAAALPLPAGAATEATLASIDGKIVAVDTGAVVVSSSALPTGAATEATLAALDAKFNSLGQKTMAASAPVVIASNQSAILVDGSGSTQPVSGTVAVTQSTTPWVVDGSGVTQPVSGTVTANAGSGNFTVVQATGTNLHAVVDSGSITVTQATGTNLHAVVDSGTVTANIGTTNGLALDATLAKLTVAQGAALGANTQVLEGASVTTAAPSYTNGQISPLSLNTAGGLRVDGSGVTQPVSIAATVAVNQAGRSKVNIIRNDYSSSNVTTGAYVQLVASTAATINVLDVFDSSGQTLVFAVGGAGSEVDQFNIYPGGNGKVELNIASGSRLSVKAVSATASVGELDINTFS